MRFMNRGWYFDADKGKGGAGTNDAPEPDTPAADDNPTSPGGRLHPERLKAEHGSAEAALSVLAMKLNTVEADNARYRQQIRDLQAQVPAEGAVVLSGDDATRWQAYQELGAPDEIRQQREQYQTLQRRQLLGEAAQAAGYKASVLETLAGSLSLELREEQHEGQAVRRPFVVPEEGDAVALTEYAAQHWADFMPSLVAQNGGQGPHAGQRPFVPQTPAGPQMKPANVAQQVIQRRYANKKQNGD